MTPEQRQRALTHYSLEAATALRIEQLEALNAELATVVRALLAASDHTLPREWRKPRPVSLARAALVKAGASHV